ncbi:SDR family oxidoreductase [Actinomadura welshii]
MLDFTGKTVLITGGGRGVGRAAAHRFARLGATVVINCFHSLEQARETQAELRDMGAEAHVLRASVARQAQVERMFAELTDLVGGLDVLVNNAAAGALMHPDELRDEHWERAWETNVRGAMRCSRLAAPLMAARGGGAIVNVSSVGAGLVMGNYVSVGTSKAALESLTRYLAVQYAPMNIRVNTASGGFINEGRPAGQFPQGEEFAEVVLNATPLKRHARVDDLASIIVMLASDDATGWVTGQTLLADGGNSLASAILSPPPPEAPEAPAEEPAADHAPGAVLDPAPGAVPEPAPGEVPNDVPEDLIAVVGMGAVLPGAGSPGEFWRLRLGGDAMLTEPRERWDVETVYSADLSAEDRSYARKSGFIHDFRPGPELAGDPRWSGEDPATEYTALWLRESLLQALDGVRRGEDDRVTCHFGHCADGSQHLEEALAAAGLARHFEARLAAEAGPERAAEAAGALSAALPLRGPRPWEYLPHVIVRNAIEGILPPRATVIDTACSSSLYALDLAIRDLRTGAADMAVCGGAYALSVRGLVMFAKLQGLSKSERIRAMDRGHDGVLFADGAGVVALKTARRARADGDRVLGYIAGVGTSSDGRGKAIYAPNAKGQELAITRAHRAAGITGDQVQWVAAHATGTPAGDLMELRSLQRTMGDGDRPCHVTSNKSQIGHTGWAAGVASLIEVLLAFENDTVPPQQQLGEPLEEFAEPPTRLAISTSPHAWPADRDRARIASVSSFGFGGTNAHVVVTDRPLAGPARPAEPARPAGDPAEPIAVVGWSTCLPGLLPRDGVRAWLRGDAGRPPARFDDASPLPSLTGIRIPPRILRTADRCQLMLLECATRLEPELGDFWREFRDSTGVIAGHMGPTTVATSVTARCYLPRLEKALAEHPGLRDDPAVRAAFDGYREEIRRLAPPASEDTLPGGMPNLIAARVANYFDFHGVNMTVDTGVPSALSGVQIAAGYLRSAELDLALVCGVNGNTTGEFAEVLTGPGGLPGDLQLAEGAFMVALTTRSTAQRKGLPILGLLNDAPGGAAPEPADRTIDCAVAGGVPHYLGGEVTKALIEGLSGPAGRTEISCRDPFTGRTDHLVLEVAPGPEADLAGQERAGEERAAGPRGRMLRHAVRLAPRPLAARTPESPALTRRTLVVTDSQAIAGRLADRTDRVICVPGDRDPDEGIAGEVPRDTDGVLVVTSMADDGDPDASAARRLRLNEAAFLVLRAVHEDLVNAGGTLQVLLLDALPDGAVHPHSGLFTGLVKSAHWDLPGCATVAVLVDSGDVEDGLGRLARELPAAKGPVIAVHDGSGRRVPVAVEEPADAGPLPVDSGSVIVATGGARGVTAEILVALAERSRARIWVLGANDLDDYPDWVFEGTDEEFAARGTAFLRESRRSDPGLPLAAAKRRLDRMRDARQARANLRRMAAHSGAGRVRYLACDVADERAVADAVDRIVADGGGIDLLLHGAGVNRSVALARKDPAEFRRIRDVKARGYLNLKRALAGRPPAIWCNFGSVVGFIGQPGEIDYTVGNDFLITAAGRAGAREFTIDWPLWKSVGFASDPLTQKFMQRHGSFACMETDEGIAYFLTELAARGGDTEVLYLPPEQRALFEERAPGRFHGADHPDMDRDADVPTPLLGGVVRTGPGEAVFERIVSPDTDPFLNDHLVRGRPAVPGTFMLEMAAEAAVRLVPGTVVTGFTETRFEAFLRPANRRGRVPVPCRAVARIAEGGPGDAAVEVQLFTDVRAPDGTLLRRDRRHCVTTVHLARRPAAHPRWDEPAPVGSMFLDDPYVLPNDHVVLSGVFDTNHLSVRHDGGSDAVFRAGSRAAAFTDFQTPALLLDGLLRVGALHSAADGRAPLLAPTGLARVDLFGTRDDLRLALEHPDGIALHYRPAGAVHAGGHPESGLFVAAAPDGKVLVRATGVTTIPLGAAGTVPADTVPTGAAPAPVPAPLAL